MTLAFLPAARDGGDKAKASTETVPTAFERIDDATNPEVLFTEERRADCIALVIQYLQHSLIEGVPNGSSQERQGIVQQTPFHNKCRPHISLADYVHRLAKYTNASSICFIIACSFIDRLSEVDDIYRVTQQTSHRLILCGVLLAAKLTDDKFRSNAYYSKVGGVSKAGLNEMELHMFTKLNFSLFTPESQIKQQALRMAEMINIDPHADLSRRSKKRISEDVDFGSEDDLPAKLPHGDDHNTVLVTLTKDSDPTSSLSDISKILRDYSSAANCAQELNASERANSLNPSAVSVFPRS